MYKPLIPIADITMYIICETSLISISIDTKHDNLFRTIYFLYPPSMDLIILTFDHTNAGKIE